MKRNNNKGFTLAELLIVVAVIAVLVAVAIPTFGSQLEKSRQAVDLSNLRGAYAAAKLEVLNQDDGDSILHNEKTLTASHTTVSPTVYAWYDPDGGTFSWVLDSGYASTTADDPPTGYDVGKATTSSVIVNTDGIPDVIFYKNNTLALKATDKPKAGTVDTGILVKFGYDSILNTFAVDQVTFNSKSRVAAITGIATLPVEITYAKTGEGAVSSTDAALTDTTITDLHSASVTVTTSDYTYALKEGYTLPGTVTVAADTGTIAGDVGAANMTAGKTFKFIVVAKNDATGLVYYIPVTLSKAA